MMSAYQKRRKAYLDWRVAQKFDKPPIGLHPKKGTTFSREYARETSAYAFLMLSYKQNIDLANELIRELCTYFLEQPDQLHEPHSFYWATEFYLKIYYATDDEMDLLAPETEDLLLEMMWQYVTEWSKIERLKISLNHHTLWYWLSENHWFQEICTAWAFAEILSKKSAYQDCVLKDGFSLNEHTELLRHYLLAYLKEKGSKGFLVEMASGSYGPRMLMMFLTVYEYAEDSKLKTLAKNIIDLWWATWAEEQINGERGGGKVRQRSLKGLMPNEQIGHLAHMYLGMGSSEFKNCPTMLIFPLYCSYTIPDLIANIATSKKKDPYEIVQRRLARRDSSKPFEPFMNIYDYEQGQCLRYSYCTSDFILGTVMRPPESVDTWILGSAQSWHHGLLIKNGAVNERIVPICVQNKDTLGEQWSVQSKGTLICQKLRDARNAKEMAVFVSEGLVSHAEQEGNFLFVWAGEVYCSICFVGTEYAEKMPKIQKKVDGQWYVSSDAFAPVILEVTPAEQFVSFEGFREEVRRRKIVYHDQVLQYTSISGDDFVFDASQEAVPIINGASVNYHPEKLFDSPFVQSVWDSGMVHIRDGDEGLNLVFDVEQNRLRPKLL